VPQGIALLNEEHSQNGFTEQLRPEPTRGSREGAAAPAARLTPTWLRMLQAPFRAPWHPSERPGTLLSTQAPFLFLSDRKCPQLSMQIQFLF